MSFNKQIVKISQEVGAGQEVIAHITPLAGKIVRVLEFQGECAFTKDCTARVAWRLNQSGEVNIWTTKGSSRMPFMHEVPIGLVDGVGRVGIAVENLSLSTVFLSAYAYIEVEN